MTRLSFIEAIVEFTPDEEGRGGIQGIVEIIEQEVLEVDLATFDMEASEQWNKVVNKMEFHGWEDIGGRTDGIWAAEPGFVGGGTGRAMWFDIDE